MMVRDSCMGVVEYITRRYDSAAEIGVGAFPDVALALAKRDVEVFATDIKPFAYEGLETVIDDVTEPDRSLYAGRDLIYALRPPPELVPYMVQLAKALCVDLIVKPLASEYPGGELTRHRNSTFFLWSRL